MKKLILFCLAMIVVVAAVGCSSDGGAVTTDEKNNPAGKPVEDKGTGGKPGAAMPPMGEDGKAGI